VFLPFLVVKPSELVADYQVLWQTSRPFWLGMIAV
jgi:hypothetical protein